MNQIDLLSDNALEEHIKHANDAYRNTATPVMSDATYDKHIEELKTRNPNHQLLTTVEPEQLFDGGKIRHSRPMLSTDKLYTTEDVQSWVRKVLNASNGKDVMVSVMAKLDGMAGRFENGVMASRGDGSVGGNLTHMLGLGLTVIGGEGDGEIILHQPYYEAHLKGIFPHPRNAVVGSVGADVLREEMKQALEDGAFRFVNFNSLPRVTVPVSTLSDQLDDIRSTILMNEDYLTDGLVISVDDEEVRGKMGRTEHHHNWLVASKTVGEVADTTVKGITWQVGGLTGRLTPVVHIEPVFLSGATISNVTAHNAGNVVRSGIGKGATIRVTRSGEVIPYISDVITPVSVDLPTACPCCGTDAHMKKDFLVCENAVCEDRLVAKLAGFFASLGTVDLFGPAACRKLVQHGYRNPSEVYSLTASAFETMGFGAGQAANLEKELHDSKSRAVDDFKLLSAMSIVNLGKGDSKKLLKHFPLEDLHSLSKEEINAIDGFGAITSESVHAGLEQVVDELKFFRRVLTNIVKTPIKIENTVKSGISGLKIVFTGKVESGSRDEMKAQAESLGAIPQGSITGKTDLLVTGTGVGQSKLNKANTLGVKVISEADYLDLINPAS